MKKISRRSFLAASGVAAATAALTACGASDSNSTSTVASVGSSASSSSSVPKASTLKILFKGPKADGWDEVYQEYLNQTKDSLNIQLDVTFVEHADYKDKLNLEMTSGADYDLVFDASWVHLKELAADGYYADLSPYFNNDQYPGLKKAFSEQVMNANRWYGQMCYIPLYRAYGNGIPCIYYRKDLAQQWGVGEIDSMEKMESYWAKAKENSLTPFSTRDSRGFFQLYTISGSHYPATDSRPSSASAGVQCYTIGNCVFWLYIKDNKVQAVAIEGSGDENFANFPEGYNYDFGMDRLEKFAEYQSKGYLSADSMTCKDENTPFWVGQAASTIGTLDEYEKQITGMGTYGSEGELGFFVYVDTIRDMIPGSYPTGYSANNGMAIPASSKNVENTIRFLDWMFGDAAHHDLFELGVEGVHWEAVGSDQFTDLTGYASNFPGYGFTWNPHYVKFPTALSDEALAYRKWETKEDSFQRVPVVGFSFDATSTEMSTYTAQVKAVADMVAVTKLHGITSDGYNTYSSMKEMLNANVASCYAAGADKLQDELVKQMTAYLEANPQT